MTGILTHFLIFVATFRNPSRTGSAPQLPHPCPSPALSRREREFQRRLRAATDSATSEEREGAAVLRNDEALTNMWFLIPVLGVFMRSSGEASG